VGWLEIPRISYKSFLARTSFTVAATLSNLGFAGASDEEDKEDASNWECDEDGDGCSEIWAQEIGFGLKGGPASSSLSSSIGR
jgi:hypothetical protein